MPAEGFKITDGNMTKHKILEALQRCEATLSRIDSEHLLARRTDDLREQVLEDVEHARQVLSACAWGPGGKCSECGRDWNIRNARLCPDCP